MITWELYSSLHSKIKQEDFTAAEARAEFEVRQVIGPRFATITSATFGFEILQEAICRTMDAQAENEKNGSGKGVTSVSNDGYSETYATATQEAATADLHNCIKAWLSGTGMVGAY